MDRGTELLKETVTSFENMTVGEYRELYGATCKEYKGAMLATVLETPTTGEEPLLLDSACVKMCN